MEHEIMGNMWVQLVTIKTYVDYWAITLITPGSNNKHGHAGDQFDFIKHY